MLKKLKELLGKVFPEADMVQVAEQTRLAEDLGCECGYPEGRI